MALDAPSDTPLSIFTPWPDRLRHSAIILLAMTPRLRRDYRAVHDYLVRERRRFATMVDELRGDR